MSIGSLIHFLDKAPHTPASAWDYAGVTEMAGQVIPDIILGDNEPLLKGDQKRLWRRWFLEGIASPEVFANDPTAGRLEVFASVLDRVRRMYADVDHDRHTELANKLTDLLFADVQRIRQPTTRDYASKATRLALISASATPRCYICGYAFGQEAKDAFLRVKGRNPVQPLVMVDILRPRGLTPRDLGIEIEHIVPVAAGGSGQANLRLACGWCNIHKSARVSLYEADFFPARTRSFNVGSHRLLELPHPFWTVRLIALRGKCQHLGGCSATAADAELFIAYKDWSGSPNPTNLAVYCEQHDPVAGSRMDYAADVRALWQNRRR